MNDYRYLSRHGIVTGDVGQMTLNPRENKACLAQFDFRPNIAGVDLSGNGRDVSHFTDNPGDWSHVVDADSGLHGLQRQGTGGDLVETIGDNTWAKSIGLNFDANIGTLFTLQLQSFANNTTSLWSSGMFTPSSEGGPAIAANQAAANVLQCWIYQNQPALQVSNNPTSVDLTAMGCGIVPNAGIGCSHAIKIRRKNSATLSVVTNSDVDISTSVHLDGTPLHLFPCWVDNAVPDATMDGILHGCAFYRVPAELTAAQIDAVLAAVMPYWINRMMVSPLILTTYL